MNEFFKCATFCWGWSGTKVFGFEFRNEFEEVRKQSEAKANSINKPVLSILQEVRALTRMNIGVPKLQNVLNRYKRLVIMVPC